MKVPPAIISLLGAVFLFLGSMYASFLGELTEVQLGELQQGKQVIIFEEAKDRPWPKVRVYQKINANPKEVAAVFFDYEKARTYVPKIIKSNISRRLSPYEMEVDYGVDVPILPDEFYTVKNTLQAGADDTYRVDWILLRALQTKASEGSLRIEPYQGGAAICYTNLVTPSSRMAGLLKGIAMEQMRNTVRALVLQVESQKSFHPQEIEKQIAILERALNAEKK